ncbi:putative ribosome biogenesis regulatory protein like protein [Blattamonas nauphoetae]|uniref:Ribosome biogenesis regulatory protein n=1 Tax=Blattamonas nauphoetae TaxID=2049346 RepID=A0ABQ9YC52_9EUKA|nr:putative ribosome biogenesis regulatory protein like protein [Blattamonas nauphoetae]
MMSSISLDLGLTAISDITPIDRDELKANVEDYFLAVTTKNMQILLSVLLKLPKETDDTGNVIVTLPKPITRLPRAKPVPVEPEPTRWEKFAKQKQIGKFAKGQKRERLVFDETDQQWKPKWGRNKITKVDPQDHIIEHQAGVKVKPGEDPFEARDLAKRESKQKQKEREEENIKRTMKKAGVPNRGVPASVALPTVLFPSAGSTSKYQKPPSVEASEAGVNKMLKLAELSTRGRGLVDPTRQLTKQKRTKPGFSEDKGKKRSGFDDEKERNLRIAMGLGFKEDGVNDSKAGRMAHKMDGGLDTSDLGSLLEKPKKKKSQPKHTRGIAGMNKKGGRRGHSGGSKSNSGKTMKKH